MSRELTSMKLRASLPGAPDEQYTLMQFRYSFERKDETVETLTTTLEKTQTLELHRSVLLGCLRRSPALALSLLRDLSARLRYATEEA